LTSEQAAGGGQTPPAALRAVFLSYASEDAPAAQRLCAALRAAGIEVWFDQSALRGGDAWDNSIRRQIKSCALFIPIISANAHARTEGYFRLEWKLAVDRSHLLAPDQTFMLPVAIDQTPQSDERLPDRFRELQWTRLPGGAATPEFIERVVRLLAPEGARPAPIPRPPLDVSAGATPAAPGMATAVADGTRAPRRRIALLAALGAAIVVAGVGLGAWLIVHRGTGPGAAAGAAGHPAAPVESAATPPSIAVLPFADESEKRDQGYFSDGLTDELIELLAKVPRLRVPARTSSFYFKGREATLADIGRLLNVSNVLEGSVRKSGNALRISAEVVRVADDTRLWSATYDRTLDDVFKVQDDIAGSVVSALKVSLLGEPKPRAAPTRNSDAYLHYLRAEEAWRTGGGSAMAAGAIAELQQAVALDASFAPAWRELGASYVTGFAAFGIGTYSVVHREALDALQRSLELDPKSADTLVGLADLYYTLDWDFATAAAKLNRALELDPNNVQGLSLKGYIADSAGRFDEAIEMHRRALSIDPLRVGNYIQLGNAYYRSGHLEEGVEILQQALKRFPDANTVHYRLALLLLAQHHTDAALAEFALEQSSGFRLLGMPLALDRLGRHEEADRSIAQALADPTVRDGAAYQAAIAYAGRGDATRTFEWLERAYRQRDAGMHWMKFDPLLQRFRQDPRFKALLAQMHES
jgi:adenylate cyclase